MAICHTVQVTVHCDVDYQYTASVGEDNELIYQENCNPSNNVSITFGTTDEMRAVAKAMLKAADVADGV